MSSSLASLKMERKYRHFDILVTGCTGCCLMTTPGATKDEKLVKMIFFPFQWTLTIQYTIDANTAQCFILMLKPKSSELYCVSKYCTSKLSTMLINESHKHISMINFNFEYRIFYTIFFRPWRIMISKKLSLTMSVSSIDINIVPPGGRLNKKDGLTRYGNSHVKDKTS